eukprot:CAMPEP_0178828124 /NCGR_PEP_ID=MMETSP0746-20121128/7657_1 /TAXON_ID=913974 /ORGANISM="Nitzschia punctata, Strain CCMP561" /LENGTH=92 /DNA_ID=CAMNT_0020490073 /DNA_START=149 /DNA_END=427 /DNA_ORIENTATION=-
MTWLEEQPDFKDTCTVYLNRHFGLDPKNPKYQKLSSYFWELYSQENGSWRDQLLWCYVVDKFQAHPVHLNKKNWSNEGPISGTKGSNGFQRP